MALRAVQPGETVAKVKPPTVSEAAESGDRLALLVAMRSRIAQTIQNPECPPRALAALSRRLDDIAKQIESITAARSQEDNERDSAPDEDWSTEAI